MKLFVSAQLHGRVDVADCGGYLWVLGVASHPKRQRFPDQEEQRQCNEAKRPGQPETDLPAINVQQPGGHGAA